MNSQIFSHITKLFTKVSATSILIWVLVTSAVTALILSIQMVSSAREADFRQLAEFANVSTARFKDRGFIGLTEDWRSPFFPRAFPTDNFGAIILERTTKGSNIKARFGAYERLVLDRPINWLTSPDGRRYEIDEGVIISPDLEILSQDWEVRTIDQELRLGLVSPGPAEEAAWNTVSAIWVMYLFAAFTGLLLILNQNSRYRSALADINGRFDQFAAGDTSVRLDPNPAAPEIRALVESLNPVLGKLGNNISFLDAFADASYHELKNPLAIALQEVMALRKGPVDTFDRSISTVYDQLRNLVARLKAIREFVRLDRETSLTKKLEAVDLSAIVKSTIKHAKPELETENRSLLLDVEDGVVVNALKTPIEIVVQNLLGNAAKYAPAGEEIRVVLKASNGRFRFSVANTGGGFPDDVRDKAFEPFTRSNKTKKAKPGLGIGLALVGTITQACGFKVRIVPLKNDAEVEVTGLCIVVR